MLFNRCVVAGVARMPYLRFLVFSIAGGIDFWQRLGLLSDQPSDWGATSSNLVPNQGDYIALVADTSGIFAGWADARGESPDVFFARFDPAREPAGPIAVRGVSLSGLHPNPSRGGVDVSYAATPGLPARLELWDVAGRRVQEQAIETPTASGALRFEPRSGLPAGVYLLRMVQGLTSTSVRLAIVP